MHFSRRGIEFPSGWVAEATRKDQHGPARWNLRMPFMRRRKGPPAQISARAIDSINLPWRAWNCHAVGQALQNLLGIQARYVPWTNLLYTEQCAHPDPAPTPVGTKTKDSHRPCLCGNRGAHDPNKSAPSLRLGIGTGTSIIRSSQGLALCAECAATRRRMRGPDRRAGTAEGEGCDPTARFALLPRARLKQSPGL